MIKKLSTTATRKDKRNGRKKLFPISMSMIKNQRKGLNKKYKANLSRQINLKARELLVSTSPRKRSTKVVLSQGYQHLDTE
jgi:hypothetical protein